jgi:hypothetical protein
MHAPNDSAGRFHVHRILFLADRPEYHVRSTGGEIEAVLVFLANQNKKTRK